MGDQAKVSFREATIFVGLGALTGGLVGVLIALPSGFAIWIGALGLFFGTIASACAYTAVGVVLAVARPLPRLLKYAIASGIGGIVISAVTLFAGSMLGNSDRWLIALAVLAFSTVALAGLLVLRESKVTRGA